MSREVHVRFREGVGVQLPRATRLTVFCPTQEKAVEAQELLRQWLATRGLRLSDEKTRIRHLRDGFNFLGFNIRHYPTQ
jgi:RNA-directed DNA polymerase